MFGRGSADAVLMEGNDRGKTTLSIGATLLSARNHPKQFGNGNQTKCGHFFTGTTDRLGHKLRRVHFGPPSVNSWKILGRFRFSVLRPYSHGAPPQPPCQWRLWLRG
ncbi:hypothetical protein FQ154_12500 [Paeniglutamicibacter gangotriensis]|uniref:Uncharacterized protein n=1 Tax=Paeniglutamicibacter gangotriensis TaxID=254787 RepID=A0A5B0EBP1_9MICC|nr:hypothetical protein FQ154_12500 [Paeniglutamicibacter gangotriensis]